jgi:hypothetical protein
MNVVCCIAQAQTQKSRQTLRLAAFVLKLTKLTLPKQART